ncbi:hypothetical protein EMPG_11270 [Blastomyces silverae]|uniref:Distal membrane-arm assembly complex protein 1-like domain-containing protein n=1 Tax=Blastomyces silverae TaxID=2060906 RepID=A0A0H1BXM9_9EURO|nr:hypothetical protein EMPG_11270 [Blastomyces silverae]
MAREDTSWDITPKDMKKAIAQEKYQDDCLACKVTGSLAFIGLGVYSYISGMNNLTKQEKVILKSKSPYRMGSRRLGIATISATLVGMGIWRALH